MTISNKALAEVYATICDNMGAETCTLNRMECYRVYESNEVVNIYTHISTATPLSLKTDLVWDEDGNGKIVVERHEFVDTIIAGNLTRSEKTTLVWSRQFIVGEVVA